jgi:hypothetical protein
VTSFGEGGKKAESIYLFISELRKRMKIDGVSGGPDHPEFDSRSIFEGALVEE